MRLEMRAKKHRPPVTYEIQLDDDFYEKLVKLSEDSGEDDESMYLLQLILDHINEKTPKT